MDPRSLLSLRIYVYIQIITNITQMYRVGTWCIGCCLGVEMWALHSKVEADEHKLADEELIIFHNKTYNMHLENK